jgi:transcriptional regulator with XRE-family HTH domain
MEQQVQRWKRFGKLLRRARTRAGYGLREFAQKVDLSPTYISRVETGKIPPPTERRIKVMARLLELPADDLYSAAGKVDPDIEAYIRRVKTLPGFLRAAKKAGLGASDFESRTRQLQRRMKS